MHVLMSALEIPHKFSFQLCHALFELLSVQSAINILAGAPHPALLTTLQMILKIESIKQTV